MRCRYLTTGAAILSAMTVMTLGGTERAAAQTPAPAAASGSELFYNHCAVCHGRGGKGDGPMGQVLTIHPADLTIIAKNSGGKFPSAKIYQLIDGRDPAVKGHGGPDMPVWGAIFAASGGPAAVRDRINTLVKHLESLQVK